MSEGEKQVRRHLANSCGNGGYPTEHSLRCIVGMIQTGEATMDDVIKAGGQWLEDQVREGMRKWG
jgi:hypothetical protein